MIFKHEGTTLFSTTISYLLRFSDGKNKICVEVTTHYQTNPETEYVSDIEFIEGAENLTLEQREEIEEWVMSNRESWKE